MKRRCYVHVSLLFTIWLLEVGRLSTFVGVSTAFT